MKIISQAEFLSAKGLNPSDKSKEVAEAKKEYRRMYMKAYRKKQKPKQYRVELRFTLRQHLRLQKGSEKYGISIPAFLIKIIFAYLDRIYVVPDDVLIRAVRMEIRRVGNNINQVALKVNASNTVFHSDIRNIQKELHTMEMEIAELFRTPVKLQDLIRETLLNHIAFLTELKEIIKEFENDYQISST